MSSKDNLELVHKMYEALNSQDLEAHNRYWTPDMIWHGPREFGDIHGVENFKNHVMKPFYLAFPDYFAKNDIEVANDNWVSATGFLTGTQRGEWMGLPPTNRKMSMRFSDFWLIRDGKLSENWVMVDYVDVFDQLTGIDLLRVGPTLLSGGGPGRAK
jgi:predicted ester cyclase